MTKIIRNLCQFSDFPGKIWEFSQMMRFHENCSKYRSVYRAISRYHEINCDFKGQFPPPPRKSTFHMKMYAFHANKHRINTQYYSEVEHFIVNITPCYVCTVQNYILIGICVVYNILSVYPSLIQRNEMNLQEKWSFFFNILISIQWHTVYCTQIHITQ